MKESNIFCCSLLSASKIEQSKRYNFQVSHKFHCNGQCACAPTSGEVNQPHLDKACDTFCYDWRFNCRLVSRTSGQSKWHKMSRTVLLCQMYRNRLTRKQYFFQVCTSTWTQINDTHCLYSWCYQVAAIYELSFVQSRYHQSL